MLYDVVSHVGVVAMGVSLRDAKIILDAYLEGYSQDPDFRCEKRGWSLWGSLNGGSPYVVCRIERSPLVGAPAPAPVCLSSYC